MSAILPETERHRLLFEWNRTAVEYPSSECVHEQFTRQAARTPDALALTFQNRSLSYRELDQASNRLARLLVARGVGPEVLVGVAIERSLDLVVALLAILKAGGAYVPLDPAYPRARLETTLDDATPLLVLTQVRLAALIPSRFQTLSIDAESDAIEDHSAMALEQRSSAENLAYVIYTSGSTGTPKGVMIEHRNVVSFFTAMDQILGIDPSVVWLAVTSVAFDISVLELFWTLTRGCRVVLQGEETAALTAGGQSVALNIETHGVTHLQCTPSLMRLLISDRAFSKALAQLQTILLGGEALPPALVALVRPVFRGRIFNMYGPTETTIWSTTHCLQDDTGEAVSIGRPIANTQTYILDEQLEPVPVGGVGELFISGAGVARGYLRRPEVTAERFLENPFAGDAAARMYRTGDLARYQPDGKLECLGRTDFQVKIRGFRIELGEIEAALESHPAVQQAVLTAREETPGDKRLIAYLVLAPGTAPNRRELRSHLKGTLPDQMQPAAYVVLQAMPLTANGKIDRNKLPAPDSVELLEDADSEVLTTDLEKSLVELWKEALDANHVGIDSNFFDMGAHSLIVAEVHGRLQDLLAREIPLTAMFRCPTVRTLAGYLQKESDDALPGTGSSVARAEARRQSLQRRKAARQS